MHYSCTQIATVGVVGLNYYNRTVMITENPDRQTDSQSADRTAKCSEHNETMKPDHVKHGNIFIKILKAKKS